MVYVTNRDLVMMNDLTPPPTSCLKMRLQCAILRIAASELEMVPASSAELKARRQALMEGLRRKFWDGAITRIDCGATMKEVLVCNPPSHVASPLIFQRQYVL